MPKFWKIRLVFIILALATSLATIVYYFSFQIESIIFSFCLHEVPPDKFWITADCLDRCLKYFHMCLCVYRNFRSKVLYFGDILLWYFEQNDEELF